MPRKLLRYRCFCCETFAARGNRGWLSWAFFLSVIVTRLFSARILWSVQRTHRRSSIRCTCGLKRKQTPHFVGLFILLVRYSAHCFHSSLAFFQYSCDFLRCFISAVFFIKPEQSDRISKGTYLFSWTKNFQSTVWSSKSRSSLGVGTLLRSEYGLTQNFLHAWLDRTGSHIGECSSRSHLAGASIWFRRPISTSLTLVISSSNRKVLVA